MPAFQVKGPDGKTYRVDAPDGATQDDAIKFVASQHYGINEDDEAPKTDAMGIPMVDPSQLGTHVPSDQHLDKNGDLTQSGLDYTNGNSPLMTTLAAVGSGMQQIGRGAGNMLGLGHVFPSVFGDDAIRQAKDQDRPISDTTEGQAGELAGNVVAALPLSEVVGAASTAARAVPFVGRVLGSALARSGIEGAINASALADPDNRGEAAGEGAGIGLVLHGALGGLGRGLTGLLQKSGATQDLEQMADQAGKDIHVPASLAGGDEGDVVSRMTSAAYRHLLPLFPGVEAQLTHQAGAARGVVQDIALGEADPLGTIIQPGAGKSGTQTMMALKDAFENQYKNTVGSYAFNVPSDLADQLEQRIKQAIPNVDDTSLNKAVAQVTKNVSRFANGGAVIDGESLLNAKDASFDWASKLKSTPEKKAADVANQWFEDHIENELLAGNSPGNAADLSTYQGLAEPMSSFQQLSNAVRASKASGGNFTMRDLAQAANPTGTLAHLGQTANEVLGPRPTAPSTAGRILAYAAGGYGGLHGLFGGALGATVGANLLATKTAQRLVMGDSVAQKAVAKLIESHPEVARQIGTMVKLTGSSLVGQSENGGSQ